MTDGISNKDACEIDGNKTDGCDNQFEGLVQAENPMEDAEPKESICEHCGNSDIEEGYLLDLCVDCRDKLVRFNLPVWVKGFALLVFLILILALTKFPEALNIGASYERAIKYEQEKRYLSAMNEYQKVVNTYPNSTNALCKLFIAQYKSGRIGNAAATFDMLIGRNVDDEQLYNEVDGVLDQLDRWYYPTKEFNDLLVSNQNSELEQVRDKVTDYVSKNPEDVFAQTDLASILLGLGDTKKAEEIALGIVNENPGFVDGSFLLGAIYREAGEYDKAIQLYEDILADNIERADAYSAIARIELKRGNDKAGLDMAHKAYNIDSSDPFVISNMILAYHFNNMSSERDKLFEIFKDLEFYNGNDYDLLTGIINGTNNDWRD